MFSSVRWSSSSSWSVCLLFASFVLLIESCSTATACFCLSEDEDLGRSSAAALSEHSDSSEDMGCENQMRKPMRLRKLAKKNNWDELKIEKLWKNPTSTLSDFSTIDGWTDF